MSKITPQQKIESAKAMTRAILATSALGDHKYNFLKGVFWIVTEASGKWNVPYWSEGVYSLVQEYGSVKKARQHFKIRHEHVYPRAWLADKIMCDPSCLDEMFSKATACLVTLEEHTNLPHDNDVEGFGRYKKSGIRIWDRHTDSWIDFNAIKL